MGLMHWLRGGDDSKSGTASAMGTALAEIDRLFRPSRHKQTEHVMDSRRRRGDIPSAGDFDPDSGTLILRPSADAKDITGTTGAADPHADDPDEDAPGRQ